MSTGFLIYLITRMDGLKSFLDIMTFILGVAIAIYSIVYFLAWANEDSDESAKETLKWMNLHSRFVRLWTTVFVLGIVANILLPSTKDMAIIVGIDKLSTSPEVNNILNQLYQTIMRLLGSVG